MWAACESVFCFILGDFFFPKRRKNCFLCMLIVKLLFLSAFLKKKKKLFYFIFILCSIGSNTLVLQVECQLKGRLPVLNSIWGIISFAKNTAVLWKDVIFSTYISFECHSWQYIHTPMDNGLMWLGGNISVYWRYVFVCACVLVRALVCCSY